MATAISDGEQGNRLAYLPESVDRVLGAVLREDGVLTAGTLLEITEKANEATGDSNLDRLPEHEVDVLFDGTAAVEVLVKALARRLANPVSPKEALKLVSISAR